MLTLPHTKLNKLKKSKSTEIVLHNSTKTSAMFSY